MNINDQVHFDVKTNCARSANAHMQEQVHHDWDDHVWNLMSQPVFDIIWDNVLDSVSDQSRSQM
jgi:hypothetical protein